MSERCDCGSPLEDAHDWNPRLCPPRPVPLQGPTPAPHPGALPVSDVDGLRAQLAEALAFTNRDGCYAIADALLPVVTAWAEHQARQRAAEVIDDLRGRLDWSESAVEVLDGYAAALADDGQP